MTAQAFIKDNIKKQQKEDWFIVSFISLAFTSLAGILFGKIPTYGPWILGFVFGLSFLFVVSLFLLSELKDSGYTLTYENRNVFFWLRTISLFYGLFFIMNILLLALIEKHIAIVALATFSSSLMSIMISLVWETFNEPTSTKKEMKLATPSTEKVITVELLSHPLLGEEFATIEVLMSELTPRLHLLEENEQQTFYQQLSLLNEATGLLALLREKKQYAFVPHLQDMCVSFGENLDKWMEKSDSSHEERLHELHELFMEQHSTHQ